MKTLFLLCTLALPASSLAQQSKLDLSVNLNGLFPTTSRDLTFTQSASNSAEDLASIRYAPARFAAFEFNYGHARQTQYVTASGTKSQVHTGIHEVSLAYVLNIPLHAGKLHPFALAGAGLMQFNPIAAGSTTLAPQSQNKPAVLWGVGTGYDSSRHFALRLQYRGLFYAAPSFKVEPMRTSLWQTLSEPSIGIVYRF